MNLYNFVEKTYFEGKLKGEAGSERCTLCTTKFYVYQRINNSREVAKKLINT